MTEKRRILLIGWDAADWEMIDPMLAAGQMPALAGLISRGARGNLSTLQPAISPMLWNSIATGKSADKHGILGFTEPDPVHGGARLASSTSRRTKALWNILSQSGCRTNVVGWWASHPAEKVNGTVVTNAFGATRLNTATGEWRVPPHAVHPPEMVSRLASLRMMPDEVTGGHILPFIPRAAEIDQESDPKLIRFARILSDCVSVQALTTEIMESGPWDFTAVYFDAIDHFGHEFMQYHPPRLPEISEHEFGIYQEVMRGAYRFHDMMLERLLELAGPDTTVILCSDHGFQSRHLRPQGVAREPAGPISWHRDFGILVMAGPGIKQGETIYGASLLDITPTILTVCGLPVGQDMDGRALTQALTDPSAPDPVPSWDDIPGPCGTHPADWRWESEAADSAALLQQFEALGYIEDTGRNRAAGSASARREQDYNLAQVHLSSSHPELAVPLLEALVRSHPWENRFIHQLAHAYAQGGWYRASRNLLEKAYPAGGPGPVPNVRLVFARACAGCGDTAAALRQLELAAVQERPQPFVHVERGFLYIDLHRLDLAEAAFRTALELDPLSPAALRGLSCVFLRQRRFEETVSAAVDAVSGLYQQPLAHYNLAVALAHLDEREKACEVFANVLRMQPQSDTALRWLAALTDPQTVSAEGSFLQDARRKDARRMAAERRVRYAAVKCRAFEDRLVPEIPLPQDRWLRIRQERPLAREQAAPGSSGKLFVIVSGLPRSGTSLMMKMLEAGGLMPLTDGQRAADDDNPDGYREWEPVKQLPGNPALLDGPEYDRCAIKVISMLLGSLPRQHSYRIIFMHRPVAEIAASQLRMLQRRQTEGHPGSPGELAAALESHRSASLRWLDQRKSTLPHLAVDFPSLISDPAPYCEAVAAFLGPELLPRPERMAAAVRPELHRQKQAG